MEEKYDKKSNPIKSDSSDSLDKKESSVKLVHRFS